MITIRMIIATFYLHLEIASEQINMLDTCNL